MLTSEICEIFKTTCFEERLRSTASELSVSSMTISKIHFSLTVIDWNKLDPKIQISESIGTLVFFKEIILTFTRPVANSTSNWHNHRGLKLLSRIRLGLRHLCKNKF